VQTKAYKPIWLRRDKPVSSGCKHTTASQFWQHWRKSLKPNLQYMDGSFVSDTATLEPIKKNFVQKYVFHFLTAHGTMQSSDQE